MADNPHFALPFRLGKGGATVNEQDTIDDVAACVVAIFSTNLGWRDEVPDFGVPDLAFYTMPLGAEDISQTVANQEPRAIMMVDEQPSKTDQLVTTINVGVSIFGKGNPE